MQVAIIGAGIAGLALALNLHGRGISCRIYEQAPELKEIGVGITLLPHAVRELSALGLQPQLEAVGVENSESRFFNRFGQLIFSEPRGRGAGYPVPELGIHRGRLHGIMFRAVRERLGQDSIVTSRRCIGVETVGEGVELRFDEGEPVRADLVVACDGVNSAVRRQFYPDDKVSFAGINTWRGTTRRKPIFDGKTYMRIGSIRTGKMVIYPISNTLDEDGNQLINWMAEIERPGTLANDWNKPGAAEDCLPIYKDWVFDWLDVPDMIRSADQILEYPMVDKDPIARWTFGRVTLAGDAAHPMYPRGSNGSAQALIDARVLADLLGSGRSPDAALAEYEALRAPQTAKVVLTNRSTPPDAINIEVEDRTGDKPFTDLSAVISQAELQAISDRYKVVAGFALDQFNR
ncbi:MAG TPA: flavin-dependent oxidoreductase [Caulobacteraceae bacterium]|jgi:2-polyprenyl-6-methoxyphenol hydroxylase-like FAD-dependent oxidoreductase|nr:flavin-dependent oxidoreductase [Caulobacteraceae bacterium]